MSSRVGLKPLLWGCFIFTAALMVCFGMFANTLTIAFIVALLIGAGIFGCMAGLYAFAPILYPAQTRTTGMGWAIGIGRLGAVLAPLVAGSLLDSGWQSGHLYYAFAVPLVLAIGTVALLGKQSPYVTPAVPSAAV